MKHAAQPHRLFALLLCAALLLSGCSQGLGSAQNEAFSSSGQGMLPQSSEATGKSDNSLSTMLSGTSEAPETPQEAATDEQGRLLPEKMVYTGHVTVETLEFDQSCEALSGMVERFGGYIESSESSGTTVYREDDGSAQLVDRYAPYVIRAIGDPAAMSSALSMRGGVIDQLSIWDIQVDVQQSEEVLIRAYTGKTTFQYAQEYKDDSSQEKGE